MNKLKEKLDALKSQEFTKDMWWEIAAYGIRILSVIIPAIVIMYQENSWQKASLGLIATMMIAAIVIIMYQPIRAAMKFVPGVIPFGIFVVAALAFKTMADALLVIGIAGLVGSVIAIPFHYKYLNTLKTVANESLDTLKQIADNLKSMTSGQQ